MVSFPLIPQLVYCVMVFHSYLQSVEHMSSQVSMALQKLLPQLEMLTVPIHLAIFNLFLKMLSAASSATPSDFLR